MNRPGYSALHGLPALLASVLLAGCGLTGNLYLPQDDPLAPQGGVPQSIPPVEEPAGAVESTQTQEDELEAEQQ